MVLVETFGMSDVGCVRELNEDCFCIHGFNGAEKGFCILADGMGGHNAGEVASQATVSFVSEKMTALLEDGGAGQLPARLIEAIEGANEKVYRMSTESSVHSGMGTTTVAAFIDEGIAYIANVGDSRAYMADECGIRQLTCDHSVVDELVKSGTITAEEARMHPQRNIITRAVGTEESVKVDAFEYECEEGETLILCSDGLSTMLEDKEIYDIVKEENNAENTVCRLIETAKERGGLDNITVICIKF